MASLILLEGDHAGLTSHIRFPTEYDSDGGEKSVIMRKEYILDVVCGQVKVIETSFPHVTHLSDPARRA